MNKHIKRCFLLFLLLIIIIVKLLLKAEAVAELRQNLKNISLALRSALQRVRKGRLRALCSTLHFVIWNTAIGLFSVWLNERVSLACSLSVGKWRTEQLKMPTVYTEPTHSTWWRKLYEPESTSVNIGKKNVSGWRVRKEPPSYANSASIIVSIVSFSGLVIHICCLWMRCIFKYHF